MPVNGNYCFNCYYYISKLVRALWLVNLAVRTLLHDQLNLKLVLFPNCCVAYHQIFLTYIASRSLKLSFTLNCVLKCANDHLNMISNWLVLLSTCFRNLNPFLTTGNRSRTRQTHNRDMINILLPSFFPSPTICGPRASRLGHKSKEKKTPVRNLRYGPRTPQHLYWVHQNNAHRWPDVCCLHVNWKIETIFWNSTLQKYSLLLHSNPFSFFLFSRTRKWCHNSLFVQFSSVLSSLFF